MSRLIPEKEVSAANERLKFADNERVWEWLVAAFYMAFEEARKGKLKTVNEQKFEEDRDRNMAELARKVLEHKYEPLRGVAFIITDPTPREIFAASFGDRMIHHFLIQQTGNFWDKRLSPRSFSCREGKGTLYGVRTLISDLLKMTNNWTKEAWVMKIDFQGYFMSLPREYLFRRMMWGLDKQFPTGGPIYEVCKYLWGQVLFDDPTNGVKIKGSSDDWDILPKSKSLFYAPEGRGIVIGNLTSQWVSNMALDPLDRSVRLELGCKHYGRYVDDAYFVAETKEELLIIREKVTKLVTGIGLTIHPKKLYLQPAKNGVPFLGTVIYPGRTVLSERFQKNLRELKRTIDKQGMTQRNLESLVAYKGLAMHYNHKKTFEKVFGKSIFKDIEKWQDLA